MVLTRNTGRVVQVQCVERMNGVCVRGSSNCLTVYESTSKEVFRIIAKALRQAETPLADSRRKRSRG